jgi:superfamily II DNA or RNA helicase
VGLFGEGFDLSAIAQRDVTIDAVLDMAPTMSLAAYMQRGGRMLRPYPGKVGIYLDHAGNSARHGFFDDEREWTLEGKAKGGKAANDNAPQPPVTCDKCFNQIKRPLPEKCPHCEKLLKREAREIEVADGELKEMTEADKRAVRQRLKQEQADCQTLDELVNLARKRGYKFPMKWAQHVHGNRRFAA